MGEVWSHGNWPVVAARLDGAARHLVEVCGVGPNDFVLDVAAGTGNVALWAARAGARVVASDFSTNQVSDGAARCAKEFPEVAWNQADMEDLPFANARFSVVLSAFGIGFARDSGRALSEMFRVVRPSGRMGLVNWTGEGAVAAALRRLRPARAEASVPWASEKELRRHLGPGASIHFERGSVCEAWESPESWWEVTSTSLPMLAAARQKMPPEAFERMGLEIVDVVRKAAEATATGILVRSGYLITVAEAGGDGCGATGIR